MQGVLPGRRAPEPRPRTDRFASEVESYLINCRISARPRCLPIPSAFPRARLPGGGTGGMLAPNRPEFELQFRKIARDVHGHTARMIKLLPQLVRRVELEIVVTGIIGKLARRDGQRAKADAG